jgi:hypothetical protein
VRGKPQRMCQASRQQRDSGTAVEIKAFASKDATVMVLPSGTRLTISSSSEATREDTDCPAPYFVMYLHT